MFQSLRTALRLFRDDCRASLSVEAAFAFPILAIGYLGFFALFDAYRIENLNQRAAYTITDLLSRKTDYVDAAYIDNMRGVFEIMTQSTAGAAVRVSVVRYDPDADEHILVWSHATNPKMPLTEATLVEIEDDMPPMSGGDSAIVVETWAPFAPLFNIVDPMVMENIVVSRPRFAPQLVWQS